MRRTRQGISTNKQLHKSSRCLNPTKHYVPRETCIRWRAPPEFQESALQNTSFPFGVRVSGHRFPGSGGTSETWAPGDCGRPRRGTQVSRSLRDICSETRRAPNEGISVVRVTEHTFLCPRETRIQRNGPVNLKYTLGHSLLSQWEGISYKGVTILLFNKNG